MSRRSGRYWLGMVLVVMGSLYVGCSRTHYRRAADYDAYQILAEKTTARPWQPPADYGIEPLPGSRLYDPSPPDDPWLPPPTPQLYAYQLPPLPESRHQASPAADQMPSLPEEEIPPPDRNASFGGLHLVRAELTRLPSVDQESLVVPVAYTAPEVPDAPYYFEEEEEGAFVIQPIGPSYWESLPPSCLVRMLEFERIRREYEDTYDQPPPDSLRDPAPKLTLEAIVYLTRLNSREYQTQKEILYRAALRLSLERFDYMLKFSPSNNSLDVNYSASRVSGISSSRLTLPGTLQADKVLATGGDLLARFANDVVLTFNGPNGFAADITSDLLLDLSQTVFQRDVQFERLTQAERDVLYAARDFLRFRKALFTQVARDYYGLIRSYRQVEIETQGYFQLVRAFVEREAEFNAGRVSRVQLDQVEQQVLSGRSTLIAVCNSLERSLDSLKLRIGLPTETPINVDLMELEDLTRRDELAVTSNLIFRTRKRVLSELEREEPNQNVLINGAMVLIQRMLDAADIQTQLDGRQQVDYRRWQTEYALLSAEVERRNVVSIRAELDEKTAGGELSVPNQFQRTMDLNRALRRLIRYDLRLAKIAGVAPAQLEQLDRQLHQLKQEDDRLRLDVQRFMVPEDENRRDEDRDVAAFNDFLARAQGHRQQLEVLVTAANQLIISAGLTPLGDRPEAVAEHVSRALEDSGKLIASIDAGLVPVEMAVDDAMLTALLLRLDLMNERGALADDWRQIKYAADDLKSVLNLGASQTLSSRRSISDPFDTTTDVSTTQLRLNFDAPLNRRAQRNTFRQALINFQAGRRSLMLAEDNIKFDVRNDLRDLAQGRDQYAISVASAALAFERVISTELEFRLRIGTVSSRDFLEAQDDYIRALSAVASRHIDHILDRMQLFLDLELMVVDEQGFWNELYDEQYQPVPVYQWPDYALPAYDPLPCNVWYSKDIYRMLGVPVPPPVIYNSQDGDALPPGEMEAVPPVDIAPEPLPEPAPLPHE